ncbi:MAG TPA: family 16 glycoside hydrolase [Opitutus sp.]|nr:family 16 glycoside hydrolase [Opitutus sp.]
MKIAPLFVVGSFALGFTPALPAADDGWISLFDGHSLAGWKGAEHPGSFRVEDGTIACGGPRGHLFYVGADGKAEFENFELSIDVLTKPGTNSGVYCNAQWADAGWPTQAGFEVQVNNTQQEFDVGHDGKYVGYVENKLTGSLYGVRNVYKSIVRDDEWFHMDVIVRRPRVQIRVNGVLVVDYIEPQLPLPDGVHLNLLGRGTFALQAHDEKSMAFYKNIRVRRLPAGEDASVVRPRLDAAGAQRLALGKDNFPLVDLHTHLKGGLTLQQVLKLGRDTGMGAGIATNGGQDFPNKTDADAIAYLDSLEGAPVFRALQAEGREWIGMFSKETRARFDYIFSDSMTWTNRAGKRLRLWIPAEAEIGPDPQAFMDELVAKTVQIISEEPIDIYVNPTFLPDSIAARYDELWTDERMRKIIDAAVAHRVAIEINARYKLPSEHFLRLAKAAGAQFTIGTNNTSPADYGDWSYPFEMIQKLGLTWRDMWVPCHKPSRAQRALANLAR